MKTSLKRQILNWATNAKIYLLAHVGRIAIGQRGLVNQSLETGDVDHVQGINLYHQK